MIHFNLFILFYSKLYSIYIERSVLHQLTLITAISISTLNFKIICKLLISTRATKQNKLRVISILPSKL